MGTCSKRLGIYTHRNKLGNTCNNVTTNFGLYTSFFVYEECFDNLSKSVVSKVASMWKWLASNINCGGERPSLIQKMFAKCKKRTTSLCDNFIKATVTLSRFEAYVSET